MMEPYPHLFQEVVWPWGPTRAKFVALDEAPPAHLISNVNILPQIDRQWVMIQLADETWGLPGGTLEPSETYEQAAQRELLEEVGARVLRLRVIGAWHCHSLAEKPYRPHLPFPEAYRLVCLGEVALVQPPSNPADGEQVGKVETVSLATVVARFVADNRRDLAELYQWAAGV